MPFTPPSSHWRGTDPTEWGTAPQPDAAAPGHGAEPHARISRGEQVAILVVAFAMLLAAWWLH